MEAVRRSLVKSLHKRRGRTLAHERSECVSAFEVENCSKQSFLASPTNGCLESLFEQDFVPKPVSTFGKPCLDRPTPEFSILTAQGKLLFQIGIVE